MFHFALSTWGDGSLFLFLLCPPGKKVVFVCFCFLHHSRW